MFEDSAEGFLARWRKYAATVHVFSRVEGSPLIECRVGGAILQLLERSGPYEAPPGDTRAIVNVTTDAVKAAGAANRLEATGIGRARGCGTILHREDPFLVVDVGSPLILSVASAIDPGLTPGTAVEFEAHPPMHFFAIAARHAPVSSSYDSDAP